MNPPKGKPKCYAPLAGQRYTVTTMVNFARWYKDNAHEGLHVLDNLALYLKFNMKTKLKNKQIAALDREVFPMLDAIKEAVLGAYLTVTPEEYATGRQYGDLPAAKQTFAICGMLKNITEHQMARYTGDKRITIHNRKRAGFRFYCGDKRFRARADLVFKNLKINPADVAYVLEKFY